MRQASSGKLWLLTCSSYSSLPGVLAQGHDPVAAAAAMPVFLVILMHVGAKSIPGHTGTEAAWQRASAAGCAASEMAVHPQVMIKQSCHIDHVFDAWCPWLGQMPDDTCCSVSTSYYTHQSPWRSMRACTRPVKPESDVHASCHAGMLPTGCCGMRECAC
jgi:hypothetical protein